LSTQIHIPVLLKETVEALAIQPGGRYIDCTAGGGGHAEAILEYSAPGGQLLGIEADPKAALKVSERLARFDSAVFIENDNFVNLEEISRRHDFAPVSGILFDLGLSSLQLSTEGRGFSFKHGAPLDMRFNPGQPLSAADIVNNYSELDLANIIFNYGEESRSRQIARQIVRSRPINTTDELARLVERVIPTQGRIHPATKTFQALRIAVNHELENLESALQQAVNLLGYEGRLVVISYHSLEDRIVKNFMRQEAADCVCPPGLPQCVCRHQPRLHLVHKRVITPSLAEIHSNPRSRSAKLRVAEKIQIKGEKPGLRQRSGFIAESKKARQRSGSAAIKTGLKHNLNMN
jgi:16S rRNA (cytosine1402-N4)-methyltransferase